MVRRGLSQSTDSSTDWSERNEVSKVGETVSQADDYVKRESGYDGGKPRRKDTKRRQSRAQRTFFPVVEFGLLSRKMGVDCVVCSKGYTLFCMARRRRAVVQSRDVTVSTLNRLEDRIRTLSERLLEAEGEEFHRVALELRAAISEHIERIRSRLAQYPLADDRRSQNDT